MPRRAEPGTRRTEPGAPRRALTRSLIMLALFAGVVFAVDQFVPGAGHRLGQASPGWLAAVLGLEIVACVGYTVLFQAVFSRRPFLVGVRRSTKVALGELGAFAITPTGLGGPVLRIWALRAGGMPWRVLIVRSISHGVLFNLPYALAAAVLGLGVSLRVLPGHVPVLTALAPLALVVVGAAGTGVVVWSSRHGAPRHGMPFLRPVRWALGIVPEGINDLASVGRRPLPLLGALGWWAGDCGALWAGFQAVGGRPMLSVLIIAYMLGQLGNTLPLPGGVGGVEPLMLGIFAASGVSLGLAAAAVVCYRTISLGMQGVLGAVAFVSLAGELRTERRPSPIPDARGAPPVPR